MSIFSCPGELNTQGTQPKNYFCKCWLWELEIIIHRYPVPFSFCNRLKFSVCCHGSNGSSTTHTSIPSNSAAQPTSLGIRPLSDTHQFQKIPAERQRPFCFIRRALGNYPNGHLVSAARTATFIQPSWSTCPALTLFPLSPASYQQLVEIVLTAFTPPNRAHPKTSKSLTSSHAVSCCPLPFQALVSSHFSSGHPRAWAHVVGVAPSHVMKCRGLGEEGARGCEVPQATAPGGISFPPPDLARHGRHSAQLPCGGCEG